MWLSLTSALPRTERSGKLLDAEAATLSAGGCVLRLGGLYRWWTGLCLYCNQTNYLYCTHTLHHLYCTCTVHHLYRTPLILYIHCTPLVLYIHCTPPVLYVHCTLYSGHHLYCTCTVPALYTTCTVCVLHSTCTRPAWREALTTTGPRVVSFLPRVRGWSTWWVVWHPNDTRKTLVTLVTP